MQDQISASLFYSNLEILAEGHRTPGAGVGAGTTSGPAGCGPCFTSHEPARSRFFAPSGRHEARWSRVS